MRRREFIAGLGGAAAWPLAARAQQAKVLAIGFLNSASAGGFLDYLRAFREGLGEGGYVEDRNVHIEYRFAENQLERLPALADDLVKRRVNVIAAGARADEAAKAATSTIPIVFMTGGDPVRTGLVTSLNRPGGNLTGVSLLASDIMPKRLELLRELVPHATTIAILLDATFKKNQEFQLQDLQAAGRIIGIRILEVWVGSAGEFDAAFESVVHEHADALVVAASAFFTSMRDRLIALAAQYRTPAIFQSRLFADSGGLISYGPSSIDEYRQGGIYTSRILKGEKPADMPVLLPTKFEFVVNLKTAKALGITVPPGVLAIADEVIE
jgi:putative tryptophan/tyrosine transport system substrate-binding protein